MQIIREHVASKAPAFDDFPGLGVKVFMIRQKDRFGAESNQYAPVYLWPSVKPMWKFIAGDGFRGIVDSFGWTPIHYWLGFAYACAADIDWRALRSVTREQTMIQPGTDLPALRARENDCGRDAVAAASGPVARAVGVDTDPRAEQPARRRTELRGAPCLGASSERLGRYMIIPNGLAVGPTQLPNAGVLPSVRESFGLEFPASCYSRESSNTSRVVCIGSA
jgi:hypothetical protein